MKTSVALLAAASLAAIASPAAAQDVANNTFTGLWGGVIGGYDVSKAGSSIGCGPECSGNSCRFCGCCGCKTSGYCTLQY